jgi:hypothetical protein
VIDDGMRPDEAAVLRLMQGHEHPAIVRPVDLLEALIRLRDRDVPQKVIADRLRIPLRQVERLLRVARGAGLVV